MTGFVYFLRCGDRVKIGYSVDVPGRVRTLQTAMSEQAVLLAALPGNVRQERIVHRMLCHLRVRGEWFRMSNDITSIIETGLPVEPERHRDRIHRDRCEFVAAIDAFKATHGLSDKQIGLLIRNDENFVWRARHGHNYRAHNRQRAIAFFSSYGAAA